MPASPAGLDSDSPGWASTAARCFGYSRASRSSASSAPGLPVPCSGRPDFYRQMDCPLSIDVNGTGTREAGETTTAGSARDCVQRGGVVVLTGTLTLLVPYRVP